jgi:hypothetical protein
MRTFRLLLISYSAESKRDTGEEDKVNERAKKIRRKEKKLQRTKENKKEIRDCRV